MEEIMINSIIEIIRTLNGGTVIPFQKDEITKMNLYSDNVELYVDSSGAKNKFFYFAEFKMNGENEDNLAQIESELSDNQAFAVIGEPEPSDSYMILLWEVEKIGENIYPYIINTEENEFFYKKYIFYYTKNELQCFQEWYGKLVENGKGCLTNTLQALQELNEESEQAGFLIRLLTKVPFLDPVFPKAVMANFDNMVKKRIEGIRQREKLENVMTVNNIFTDVIGTGNYDEKKLADLIYQKFVED